jgi:hypothetical protein
VQRKLAPLMFEYLAIRRKRKGGRHATGRTPAKPVQRPRTVVLAHRNPTAERAVSVSDGSSASPPAAL